MMPLPSRPAFGRIDMSASALSRMVSSTSGIWARGIEPLTVARYADVAFCSFVGSNVLVKYGGGIALPATAFAYSPCHVALEPEAAISLLIVNVSNAFGCV